MLAKTESIALVGTEGRLVEVEVDVAGNGLPGLTIVGLPTKSVREAEQRTRSAIESSGEKWPGARKVANLAPGGLPKEGTHFDLPIALGILAGSGRIKQSAVEGWIAIGELALDGSLRAVRGALAAAMACRASERKGLLCPAGNAAEAAIAGIEVVAVGSLSECIRYFTGAWEPPPVTPLKVAAETEVEDLREVRGHSAAKRAVEIAATGGHNLVMVGPPGAGKTMLARRLPGILPEMSMDEALEVTRVYSVAGLLIEKARLIIDRPMRMPHHSVSVVGLIGGGVGLPHPGEISLAHHGTLFLDELTLYRREALESLRGPLEEGVVRIVRSGGAVTFPCKFSLVAAMNPCPCGYAGDHRRACTCSAVQLARYGTRLSGPLLDRIDIQVAMARLTKSELLGAPEGDSSETVRKRVEMARAMQTDRYGSPKVTNASCSRAELEDAVRLSSDGRDMLGVAIDSMGLSARGFVRVMRIARTIADLAESYETKEEHIAEALTLRLMDVHEGSAQ